MQAPPRQVSLCVQALPSSHEEPSGLGAPEHTPVAGLHTPPAVHWVAAPQITGFCPEQIPAWQVSVCVQASPSSQAVPAATGRG